MVSPVRTDAAKRVLLGATTSPTLKAPEIQHAEAVRTHEQLAERAAPALPAGALLDLGRATRLLVLGERRPREGHDLSFKISRDSLWVATPVSTMSRVSIRSGSSLARRRPPAKPAAMPALKRAASTA